MPFCDYIDCSAMPIVSVSKVRLHFVSVVKAKKGGSPCPPPHPLPSFRPPISITFVVSCIDWVAFYGLALLLESTTVFLRTIL